MVQYVDVVNKIMTSRRFGKAKGVDVSREILDKLNRPEKEMKIIHVAGTNGKGSTCAFINGALTSMGYKVGLFTSPHLIDFTERIQINGECISEENVVEYANLIFSLELYNSPTMFDYCLCIALMHFQREKCDYVVLETGLGGLYDSTNAIITIPKVTIITNISKEHTAILGDTIEDISRNKAGIIKKGTCVVLSNMPYVANEVIKEEAKRRKALDVINARELEEFENDFVFEKNIGAKKFNDYISSTYQKYNSAAAIEAILLLFSRDKDGFIEKYMNAMKDKTTEKCTNSCDGKCDICKSLSLEEWFYNCLFDGINKTIWPGRFEQHRNLIIDGAHNPDGFKKLKESLLEQYQNASFKFIVGVLADKDFRNGIKEIKELADKVYTVTIDDDRAKMGEELRDELRDDGFDALFIGGEDDAVEFITKNIINNDEKNIHELYNDVYVLCGSLYFVGNVKGKLCKLEQEQKL